MSNIKTRVEKLENKLSEKREGAMDMPLWQRERVELEGIREKEAKGEGLTPEEQEKLDRANEKTLRVLEILREAHGFETLDETVDFVLSKRSICRKSYETIN